MSLTFNGLNGLSFGDGTSQNTAASGFGFKNRLINGDVRINQRSGTTSVSLQESFVTYVTVDRWNTGSNHANATIQQVADAPIGSGLTHSVKITATSAASVSPSSYAELGQRVEGLNVADFMWGTAQAVPAVFSFYVKSSLIGQQSAYVYDNGYANCYPFTYTINAANTWERKTIIIPGPTTGNFPTNTNYAFEIGFNLLQGSNYEGTANTWQAANFKLGVAGSNYVLKTNGATIQFTGMQLEKGSTATSFDFRDYGNELRMCQRYYLNYGQIACSAYSNQGVLALCCFPVTMRATPTISLSYNGIANRVYTLQTGATADITPTIFVSANGLQWFYYLSGSWATGAGTGLTTNVIASAEI